MIHPTVDTFEQDIVKEIHQKEASIMDIASSVGDISNKEDDAPKDRTLMMSILGVLIVCGIIGVGYLVYLSYQGTFSSAVAPTKNGLPDKKVESSGIPIGSLSPSLDKAVGQFLTNAQKTNVGYVINVVSYSPVFAYMLRNEKEFADDFALAVGNGHTAKNIAPSSPKTPTMATSTGTSTPTTSTSTPVATSTITATDQNSLPTEYIFSDITINNQNMRVATSVYGTVAYAFIGTNTLIISSSPEGIIALRSSILNK